MSEHVSNIWNEFHDRLKGFVLKRVRDEQSAEDILQDVFLKMHSRIHTLKDTGKLRSWVYQITRNAIIDHFRDRNREEDLKDLERLPAPAADSKAMKELSECIRELIERLPPLYREPLLLATYQDLTQQEIAGKLGLTVVAAKSRVQRARRKLRDLLIECCHDELESFGVPVGYQQCCACCSMKR